MGMAVDVRFVLAELGAHHADTAYAVRNFLYYRLELLTANFTCNTLAVLLALLMLSPQHASFVVS
jgi:hypothetical protein